MADEPTRGDKTDAQIRQDVADGYNAMAEKYTEWAIRSPGIRIQEINKFIALLPKLKDTHVLELGCGAGVPATQLLVEHFSVTGVDM